MSEQNQMCDGPDSDIDQTCELMASDSRKGPFQCIRTAGYVKAPDGKLIPVPDTYLIGPLNKTKVHIKEQPIPQPDLYLVEVMNAKEFDMGGFEVHQLKKAIFVKAMKWALSKAIQVPAKVAGGIASVVFEIFTPSDLAKVTFIYGQLADGSQILYTVIGRNPRSFSE